MSLELPWSCESIPAEVWDLKGKRSLLELSLTGTRKEKDRMSYTFSQVIDLNADEYPDVKLTQQMPPGIKLALKEHQSVISRFVDDAAEVVGSTGKIRITISGHANPDHDKPAEWGGEFMAIRLDEVLE